jgi:hypothetical protein
LENDDDDDNDAGVDREDVDDDDVQVESLARGLDAAREWELQLAENNALRFELSVETSSCGCSRALVVRWRRLRSARAFFVSHFLKT